MVEVNGCDFWPDGSWKVCCDAHDVAFYNEGGMGEFFTANWDLVACVADLSNWLNASVMLIGVTVGGAFVWKWKQLDGKSIFELITKRKY